VIPIYVISLATAAERRAHIKSQLDHLGLQFQFVEGVNGRALTDAAREQAAPSRMRRWPYLTGGEIGCALSHLGAIRTIAAGSHRFGIVFEDDVVISPEFPQFINDLERNAPSFDVMWLSHSPNKKHRLIMPLGQVASRQIRARVYLQYTLAATIYTREAARRIASSLKIFDAPIDIMLWCDHAVPGLRVVETHPYIVEQDGAAPSTIGSRQATLIGARNKIQAKIQGEIRRYTNMVRRWCSFVSAWGPAAVLKLRRSGSLP
jgi:GR25 family glycosyltransferase involved in LPS biosynthesis